MALKMRSLILLAAFAFATVYASAPVLIDAEASSILNDEADDPNYMLDNFVAPTKYDVEITIPKDFSQSYKFKGKVAITLSVTGDPANQIIELNSKVKVMSTFLNDGTTNIDTTLEPNIGLEKLLIHSTRQFDRSKTYVLTMLYEGDIQKDLTGLYLGSYANKDGQKEFFLATQFQPTYARKLMPCFDEPRYKATFNFKLTYPTEYKALFNTKSDKRNINGESATEEFSVTPKMSTYILAFAITKFNAISTTANDITHTVWNRYELRSSAYALQISHPIVQVMEGITKQNYKDVKIGKIDQIALPEFSAGAMENWGLVTYREAYLLHDEESTTRSRRNILTIVAHELSHFWFGNLKTTDWWDTTWLNEGFARYFEYMAANEIEKDWELEKQFVIEQHLAIMASDSSDASPELNKPAFSPAKIRQKFGPISYNKGATIIRMLSKWTNDDMFKKYLETYFKSDNFDTTTPHKLWTAMEGIVPNHPTNKNLADIMKNYVEKPGFPLLTVKVQDKSIVITQKRFSYTNLKEENKHKYDVRVNYQIGKIGELGNIEHKWLTTETSTEWKVDFDPSEKMILVNVDAAAYARVNYEKSLWQKIIKALKAAEFGKISDITRAQLVDDALNIARADNDDLTYEAAFELLTYLEKDTSYYPWYVAYKGFEHLLRRLEPKSDESNNLKIFILQLMKKVYTQPDKSETKFIRNLKKSLTKSWACNLGDSNCISEMKELFNNLKTKGIEIDNDLKSTAYCEGVRESEENWNWLVENKLDKTNSPSDARLIIAALGCSKIEKVLEECLQETLDPNSMIITKQDIYFAFVAAISGNPENVAFVTKYFQDNYSKIEAKGNKEDVTDILSALIDRFTTKSEVEKFRDFLKVKEVWFKDAAHKLLDAAVVNIEWTNKSKTGINSFVTKYLRGGDKEDEDEDDDDEDKPNGSGSVNISISLILCNVFAYMYFNQ